MTITERYNVPKLPPPLDESFHPAVIFNREFLRGVQASGRGQEVVIGVQRVDGSLSRYEAQIYPAGHANAIHNGFYCERLVKFLLWQRGGCRVFFGGPAEIGNYLQQVYAAEGERAFDYHFMGQDVYQQTFSVVVCAPEDVPAAHESEQSLGRHLEGCRIGFDLGASDVKVSAVQEGQAVFSREIEWDPRSQTDPQYHRQQIMAALKLAASKLPHVDAIGGSSAGVIINNRPMVASLFRGIPKDRYDEVHDLFTGIRDELRVPVEVVNDGEVSALAGSMALERNAVLGIALGSSLATGYVTPQGNITNWLNELAFAPIDYNPDAPVDEWSGDRGVGALYLSQQCVFRLSPKVGIDIPSGLSNAQKLKFAQERLEAGHNGARQIWESMGIFLGYAIAHYASFYDLENVLLLGRCTSGMGGLLILEGAKQVLQVEFPELAEKIELRLPDEKSRRVGQSIAAASLPRIE
ncbi:MAG: ROK family protein [Chloroflexota bacterium]